MIFIKIYLKKDWLILKMKRNWIKLPIAKPVGTVTRTLCHLFNQFTF